MISVHMIQFKTLLENSLGEKIENVVFYKHTNIMKLALYIVEEILQNYMIKEVAPSSVK